MRKKYALARQSIQRGRLDCGVSVAPNAVNPRRVHSHQQYVAPGERPRFGGDGSGWPERRGNVNLLRVACSYFYMDETEPSSCQEIGFFQDRGNVNLLRLDERIIH